MNVIFKDPALEEIFNTGRTQNSRYKKLCRDAKFVEAYYNVIDTFKKAECVASLALISRLHYEKLKYRPESSVRIINGRVERLLFTESESGIEVTLIEINTKHYGNKR